MEPVRYGVDLDIPLPAADWTGTMPPYGGNPNITRVWVSKATCQVEGGTGSCCHIRLKP